MDPGRSQPQWRGGAPASGGGAPGARAPKARESRRRRCREGRGQPPPQKIFFLNFNIVHSGAFSCTNSKVLFAIKCRERYMYVIITLYSWRLTVIQTWKHQGAINLVNLSTLTFSASSCLLAAPHVFFARVTVTLTRLPSYTTLTRVLWRFTGWARMNFFVGPMSTFLEVIVWQTDEIKTDRHDRNYYHSRFNLSYFREVNKSLNTWWSHHMMSWSVGQSWS